MSGAAQSALPGGDEWVRGGPTLFRFRVRTATALESFFAEDLESQPAGSVQLRGYQGSFLWKTRGSHQSDKMKPANTPLNSSRLSDPTSLLLSIFRDFFPDSLLLPGLSPARRAIGVHTGILGTLAGAHRSGLSNLANWAPHCCRIPRLRQADRSSSFDSWIHLV